MGRKKKPFYRVVAIDSRKPRYGREKEILGTYNPMLGRENPDRVVLKKERINYWISVGAQSSKRVIKLLSYYN